MHETIIVFNNTPRHVLDMVCSILCVLCHLALTATLKVKHCEKMRMKDQYFIQITQLIPDRAGILYLNLGV